MKVFSYPHPLDCFIVPQKAWYYIYKIEALLICGSGSFVRVTHGFDTVATFEISHVIEFGGAIDAFMETLTDYYTKVLEKKTCTSGFIQIHKTKDR